MAARYSQYIKLTHFIGDLFILNIANLIANYLKFKGFDIFESPKHFFIVLINVIWLMLVLVNRPYQISRVTQVIKVIKAQSYLIGLHFLFISSFYFFANKLGYSKEYILTFYGLLLILRSFPKRALCFLSEGSAEEDLTLRKLL